MSTFSVFTVSSIVLNDKFGRDEKTKIYLYNAVYTQKPAFEAHVP